MNDLKSDDLLKKSEVNPAGVQGLSGEVSERLPGGAVLEALFSLQRREGYLSEEGLRYLSSQLGVPLSQIYGVATFYNAFSLVPRGRHQVRVCYGTACHVRGARSILERLERELGVKSGETTPDRKFSLHLVRCVGSCSLAPVVMVDGRVRGRLKVGQISQLLVGYE